MKKCPTAKEMFDAVEKRYVGNEDMKKNKGKLLKKEMSVFKFMQNESLDDIINRYYHLISELESHDVLNSYTTIEINEKLLDALPNKWDVYSTMIKDKPEFETMTLEEVVDRLRNYELNMRKKDTKANQVQDPGLYHANIPSASSKATDSGTTAFFSGDSKEFKGSLRVDSDGQCSFVASSGSSQARNNSSTSAGSASNNKTTRMPMNVKTVEEQIALYASFIAAYENYVNGTITDPEAIDEDYDQIDDEELEEMDLQ